MTRSRGRTLLKGLSALAVLAVAVVGVPLLLETVAGTPIPDALPTWNQIGSSLTRRDDGALLLGLLKYAAWAGWALFVLSVVADVLTRLRGLPTPRLGPQQHLATQLVGAVLALAVSVPTALPANAVAVPGSSAAPAGLPSVAVIADRSQNESTASLEAVVSGAEQGFEEYRVRRGDCLWDIAWNELGEPERWPEIYEASRSVRQPGGGRLTDPDLIVTGWVLHIPEQPKPSSGLGGTAHREPVCKPPSVVTPFRNMLNTPHSARPNPSGKAAANPPVRTALSTPVTAGTPASVLEVRWTEALRSHDSAIENGREWRDRLSPGSD